MAKIDSLEKLIAIKESRHDKTILRDLGDLHRDDVIEIFITGNESEKYAEIQKLFNELKTFVRSHGLRNCRFLFKDDPNQKEKFNVEINFNVCANVKCNSLKTDSIKSFILKVASMKNQTLEYADEVTHE